jgi:hypothetical protein
VDSSPAPDSGILRESIDLAREAIKDNVKYSQNNRWPWVLSGGIARCGECGWSMTTHSVWGCKSKHVNHYYRCSKVQVNYAYKSCPNTKHHRADRLEPLVWTYVSGVMKNSEELRADLDRVIDPRKAERARRSQRGCAAVGQATGGCGSQARQVSGGFRRRCPDVTGTQVVPGAAGRDV